MANSETSFADRLGQANKMLGFITGFDPAFAPSNAELNAVNFGDFLESIATANDAADAASSDLTDATDLRRAAAEAIQVIALSVKDHVTSNRLWKRWHTPVSRAADDTRGYSLPKKKPAPAPGAPPARRANGSLSQQSYADIDKLFGKLIQAVKKITGYTALAGSGLSVAELETQRAAYQEQNDACSQGEADLESAIDTRESLYTDKETGLRARMKAIKKATRSQYGAKSAAYSQVKGIRL